MANIPFGYQINNNKTDEKNYDTKTKWRHAYLKLKKPEKNALKKAILTQTILSNRRRYIQRQERICYYHQNRYRQDCKLNKTYTVAYEA